jgi:UDPglucose 6-dehydrogenase
MDLNHPPPSSSAVDTEDLIDISTAPTTPDGSLTFSPVLQPTRLRDALEDVAAGKGKSRKNSNSLDAVLSNGPDVRNICCVGAGYVGRNLQCQRFKFGLSDGI